MKKVITPLIIALGLWSNTALASDSVDESKDASANGFVKINVVRGSVDVTGWSRNQVEVTGTLDEKTREFIFDVKGDDTVIDVKIPHNISNWCCDDGSDLHIKVPAGSKLVIGGVSTDVSVEKIGGGLEVGNVSGDIRVVDVEDRVRLSSVSGQIELRQAKGRIRIKSVSGEIEVSEAHGQGYYHSVSGSITLSDVSDELDIESVSGEIEISDAKVSLLRGTSVSGDVDVDAEMIEGAGLDFETISGSIRLRLSGEMGAKYDLETGSGSIRNRISDDRPRTSKYSRDEALRFTLEGGTGEVIANTRSGDIVLSKN